MSAHYHRSVELSRIRRHMEYRQEDFAQDWDTAIALAQLLTVDDTEHRRRLLDEVMMRVTAYQAAFPEEAVWLLKTRQEQAQ